MSLEITPDTGSNKEYKRVPDGSHLALPVQIIDLGKQVITEWPSQEPKLDDDGNVIIKNQVYITSEFPEVTDTFNDVEKPLWVGKTYNVSMNERAKLFEYVNATDKTAKNLADTIGKAYTAQVASTDGGKAKITACTPCANKLVIGDAVVKKEDVKLFNEPVVYSIDDGQNEVYAGLPDWLKEKIDNQADDSLKPAF